MKNYFTRLFLFLSTMNPTSCFFKYSKLKLIFILFLISFFVGSCALGIGYHSIQKDKSHILNKNPVFEAEYAELLEKPAFRDTI